MKRLHSLLATLALTFTLFQPFSNQSSAVAIEGGQPVLGTPLVLPLMLETGIKKDINGIDKPSFWCSASLVSSQIILTAAHCVAKRDTTDGSLAFPIEKFKILSPGSDFMLNSQYINIDKVIFTPGYANYWHPELADARTQKDDIAFLFLAKPITPELASYKVEIATEAEVNAIKSNGALIQHFGYGLQKTNLNDGKPYQIELTSNSLGSARYSNPAAENSKTISTNETGAKALCPGDSGSPWYATIDGRLKLVANTIGGSGCGGGSVNGTLGTLVYPYLDLMEREWNIFKSTLPSPTVIPKSGKKIICFKGKIIKTVSGTSPKCPTGFKKK